ncbi:MAG: TolC family protein [Gemmataceae bacterium]
MRWKRLGTLVALLTLVGGCSQRCFMTEAEFNRTTTTFLEGMELKPDLATKPITEITDPPPTLTNLDRKVRFISLAECVAIALENGRVGQANLLFPGTANDNLVQYSGAPGSAVTASDAIRVFALAPARAGAEIEASLSKFDAVFTSSLQYQNTDTPVANAFQRIQAGALNAIQQEQATASMGLLKPMATGGVAGITFNVPYTYSNLPNRANPAYTPQLQFQFEQPLLQGFGVEINQLRAQHPGSLLTAGALNTAPTSEGILISRLRFDEQRAEFERQVNQMLLNVEWAYWNLYGSYWQVYSREQGLRFALEAFKLTKAKYEAGRATAAEFYQTRGQYERFRAQRLQQIDQTLEYERQLRSLMGIPVEDKTRLVPSDSPTLAPYQPDWKTSLAEALVKRPELHMIRQEIKANQMRLILIKNSLLPDLRFTSTYDINSLGSRLDGGSSPIQGQGSNAFRGLADNNFNSWSIGLRANIPLGFRLAHSQLRQAQIDLARTVEVLKDNELKAQSYLAYFYRRINLKYEQIRASRSTREAFGEQLRAAYQAFIAGRDTPDKVLEAQNSWADALASEYQAIVDYNTALCGFEFAKGTIQDHDNVKIAEGPVPQCVAVRAVDHERQRTAAVILKERAAPVPVTPVVDKIEMPDGRAPTLPAVMAAIPPIKDAPPLPASADALHGTLPKATEASPEELFPTELAPVDRPAAPGSKLPPANPAPLVPPAPMPPEVEGSKPLPTSTRPAVSSNQPIDGGIKRTSATRKASQFGTDR